MCVYSIRASYSVSLKEQCWAPASCPAQPAEKKLLNLIAEHNYIVYRVEDFAWSGVYSRSQG